MPHRQLLSTTIRVAAVQMESTNGRIAANLERATRFVEEAARKGAELILLPEFVAAGYVWTTELWNAAESREGPTFQWLCQTSQRLGVSIGTTFLEAEDADFYNTFVLTAGDGSEVGRVRKQTPSLYEAFFFKGQAGPHAIQSTIGRIGVGICYENYLAYLPQLMCHSAIDLMLMPHCVPSFSEPFPICKTTSELFKQELREIGTLYAAMLGVPVIMANQCGPWRSGLPHEVPSHFLGGSAIVDSDGTVKAQLGTEEGIVVGDVTLDPSRKITKRPRAFGRWVRKTSFRRDIACWIPERAGSLWYLLSPKRRARAKAISSLSMQ